MFSTQLLDIERHAYGEILGLMRRLVDIKRGNGGPEVLMILEHDPVLTMGRRAESSDILVPGEFLSQMGIDVYQVERGGLITYHGPGQLVGYTIFNLRNMGLSVGSLVQGLEDVVCNVLSDFDIAAQRIDGKRGVWVDGEKIASVGVAIRGGISFHGVALNYDPNLSHFDLINPCGLSGVRMTSMSKIIGESVDSCLLREKMTGHFQRQFQLDLIDWSLSKAMEYSS